jgi:hypothetical protein
MAYSFGCSASRPFGNTPQGARGESRKRLSPFLIQLLHLYALVAPSCVVCRSPSRAIEGNAKGAALSFPNDNLAARVIRQARHPTPLRRRPR